MDELVRQGLAKWPNVPDCFGWLALDRRGRWRIGAEREFIRHKPTNDFIARNYLSDPSGRWLFQNGPQRVYVSLDFTPYVWRLMTGIDRCVLTDHTGQTAEQPDEIFIDDTGQFVLVAGTRVGVLHDHDSQLLIGQLRSKEGEVMSDDTLGRFIEHYLQANGEGLTLAWPNGIAPIDVRSIARAELPGRYHFNPRPEGTAAR